MYIPMGDSGHQSSCFGLHHLACDGWDFIPEIKCPLTNSPLWMTVQTSQKVKKITGRTSEQTAPDLPQWFEALFAGYLLLMKIVEHAWSTNNNYNLSIYLPVYTRTYLPTYLSTYIPTYLSTTYLPIYTPTYFSIYLPTWGARGGAVGWGTALQVRRSRVRFLMVSLEFFIDIILLAALWPWGRLSL